MKLHALSFVAVALFAQFALADKILSPGEIYTSSYSGEQIACAGASSAPKQAFHFLAEGMAKMAAFELNDPEACTIHAQRFDSMWSAKNIAISNGTGIQCKAGYKCDIEQGEVQYRKRGDWCYAYVPFKAWPN